MLHLEKFPQQKTTTAKSSHTWIGADFDNADGRGAVFAQ